MAKNMRIELRVEEDERALWKEAAEKEGLAISAWLRQLARVETEVAPKMPETDPKISRPSEPESYTYNPEMQKVMDERLFKRKVAQIMGKENLTQDAAERKVREELG